MHRRKIWRVKECDPALQYILARELGVSPLMSKLLINRGLYRTEDAQAFLSCELSQLHSSLLLKDMERAVERILLAIKHGEKILVYGDYDADGITATAVLVKILKRINAQVDYYIPHRLEEGYGLHLEALQWARDSGFHVVVTVDCGINGLNEVEWALSEGGPDIVITDHHETPVHLPRAFAVVNPKRPDCGYPFKGLAGVGVALKLGRALLEAVGMDGNVCFDYLDLVCIGTVADIVPLLGENRILVKHGLRSLANTTNPGLNAIMSLVGIKREQLSTREVGFTIAPRLNAAGRIGDARDAVELLLSEDVERALQLANQLNKGNQDRQQVESRVFAEAMSMIDSFPELGEAMVIVLAAEGWHPGVIGIVASRLVDRFYRPVLMVALDGDMGKGSARSIPGFHMYEALSQCNQHLLDFGGHAGAAGFSVQADKVDLLRQALNEFAQNVISAELLVPGMELDSLISLNNISEQLITELGALEPYGQQNPEPLLGCCNVEVINCRGVGRQGAHLKMTVREADSNEKCPVIDSIGFHLGEYVDKIVSGDVVDLAFVPGLNYWNGRTTMQLQVMDIEPVDILTAESKREVAATSEQDTLTQLFKQEERRFKQHKHLFLPDFIVYKLNEYGKLFNCCDLFRCLQDNNAIMPSMSLGSNAKDISSSLKTKLNRKNIADIRFFLSGPGRKLILVNSPHQAVELAIYLRLTQTCPKTAFYHRGMGEADKKLVLDMFCVGDVQVITTTPALAPDLVSDDLARIGVYQLPFNRVEWNCILETARTYGNVDIHFMFEEDDKLKQLCVLEALAPSRDCLAAQYCFHKRTGSIGVMLERVISNLHDAGFKNAGEHTMVLGLNILKEVGLLNYIRHDEKWEVQLLPTNGAKVQLTKSPTFQWLQKTARECKDWQNYIIQLSQQHN